MSSEEYFNSSKLKVIGMITAATVAVGALGGIAGVVFDPEPVSTDNVVQPGTGGARLSPQSLDLGTPGQSAPGHASPATLRLLGLSALRSAGGPGAASTTVPSPIGTATPGGGGFTSAPTPTPTPGGPSGGSGVTLTATGVDVFVPDGWAVDSSDENRAFLSNGQGSYSFAFSFQDDPSTAAGDVITNNLDNLLPAENYTQLQTSDVTPLQPFGALVSLAGIEYEALWVDNQGSASIHGQIYVGVRQDGTVLGILVEHLPAEDFEAAFEEMIPILDNSYNRFAGVS